MTWKGLVAALGAILMLIAVGSVASANGGPHGDYGTDISGAGLPSQCGACHRVHQGKSSSRLLKAESPYALCLTCHNGAGSRLDVLDGVKLSATITPDEANIVRAADTANFHISVAPKALLNVPEGGSTAEFTVAVYNRTAGSLAVTLSVASDSNLTDFNASTLGTTALTVPAGTVSYSILTTSSKATAVSPDSNITTVHLVEDATPANTADVKVQTRINTETTNVLNGGGFRYINGVATTSRHNADPADNSLQPWGYLTNTGLKSGELSTPLQCTSCHNPHGTTNYRIIKNSVNTNPVNVQAWYGGAFTNNEGARGNETGSPADKYTKEYYGSQGTGKTDTSYPGQPIAGGGSLASLCGACHNAYPSDSASTAKTAGGVTHYRHATEMPYTEWTGHSSGPGGNSPCNPETFKKTADSGADCTAGGTYTDPVATLRLASNSTDDNKIVTCLTCHRVHGTTSTMSNYALQANFGGLADNDLTPSQMSGSLTTLLYTNNRGMCQACHQW